jgi:pimeloyl-ACP methyl ester carboxylesterase
MATMREASTTIMDEAGPLKLGYVEWGDANAPRTVLCIHGLTRSSRDFDFLAAALARDARVIAIDVAGRGRSGWLADPTRYVAPTYVGHMAAFLGNLGLRQVDLVGTSMGGIIGMALATLPTAEEAPPLIRRLVLNDIGGMAPASSLAFIADYLGAPPKHFPDLAAVEAHLRIIHESFGPLTDAQWAHLARHSARPSGDGWVMHYDPAIAAPFVGNAAEDVVLWPLYDLITAPTLVLRGGDSILLPADVAEEMKTRGPKAEVVTFPGIGHAPALMDDDQIAVVRDFLARP